MDNLQGLFLNQIRIGKIPVIIYLINGFQLRGLIKGFDNFSVAIEVEGKQQVIFKRAISTIMPLHPVNLNIDEN